MYPPYESLSSRRTCKNNHGDKKVSRAQLNAICMNRGMAVTARAYPGTIYNSQVIGYVSS